MRYFQLSSEWYFDINIVRSSSIFHFTKLCFKAQKRYLFFGFKRSHERCKKVPFLLLEAMFAKAQKRYLSCSWKWCCQRRKKGTFKIFAKLAFLMIVSQRNLSRIFQRNWPFFPWICLWKSLQIWLFFRNLSEALCFKRFTLLKFLIWSHFCLSPPTFFPSQCQ